MSNVEIIEKLGIELLMESGDFSKQMKAINKTIKDADKEFQKARKEIEDFENTFTGLGKTIDKNKKQIEEYTTKLGLQEKEFEKLEKEFEQAKNKLDELERTQGKSSDAWQKQAQIVGRYSDKLVKLNGDIEKSKTSIDRLTEELSQAEQAFAELGNETQDFESQLAAIKKEFDETQEELNQVARTMDGVGQSFNRFKNEAQQLQNCINATEKEITQYRNEIARLDTQLNTSKSEHAQLGIEIKRTELALQQAKSEYGQNSKEAQQLSAKLNGLKDDHLRLSREIKDTEDSVGKFRRELKGLENDLDGHAQAIKDLPYDHMTKGLDSAKESMEGINGKLEGVRNGFLGLGTVGVVSVVDIDNKVAQLKSQLGLTDKETQKLKSSAQKLSKDGYDFGESIESITLVEQHLSYLPDALSTEDFSSKIMAISKMFDVDISEVVRATSQVMHNFNVDGTKALDGIVWGFQNGMDVSGEWLDTLTEYSTQFDIMGMGFEDMLAVLATGIEEGAWSLDQLADGVKEFKIRLLEVGDTQADALKKLGFSTKEVKAAYNGTAEEGQKMAFKVATALLGVKDETKRNELAVALFGTKYEDVGDAVVKAVSGMETKQVDLNGKVQETEKTFEETFGAKLRGKIAELMPALERIGEALLPIIEDVIELGAQFADWFLNMDEGTQKTIVMFGAFTTFVLPLMGNLIGLISTIVFTKKAFGGFGGTVLEVGGKLMGLGGKATDTGGKMDGLGGKMSSLGGSATTLSKGGLWAIVLALFKVADSIGDSELAIMGLQEKFGGFGVVISGVCEFISGVWDLTIGNIWLGCKLLFDVIAAMMDGQGGLTVKDAWNRFNEDMDKLNEDAISKIYLTSTKGYSQLLNANDTHLNNVKSAYERIMPLIPQIVGGNYQKASTDMSHWLSSMSSEELTILQGMNDQTKFMFSNITKSMSTEEVKNQLINNFENMKSMGLLKTSDLEKGVTDAMNTIDQQLGTKSKSGGDKVVNNVDKAKNSVNKSTQEMANQTGANMGNMDNEMQQKATNAYKGVSTSMHMMAQKSKQSASEMHNGVRDSTSAMSQKARESASTMHNGVRDSASAMSQKARESASAMYRGVTTSTNRMANEAISDWNRIRSAFSRSIHGQVYKTTFTTTKTKAAPTPRMNYDLKQRSINRVARQMVSMPNLMQRYDFTPKFSNDFGGSQNINIKSDSGSNKDIAELKILMKLLIEVVSSEKKNSNSYDKLVIENVINSKMISDLTIDLTDRKLANKKIKNTKFKGGSKFAKK